MTDLTQKEMKEKNVDILVLSLRNFLVMLSKVIFITALTTVTM